ncbi:MAG: SAM-dependent methyltransferase [Candidatus Methylacidiphilales bacterium]|nr:SAM-dependent methyltransferase [Candidatus Methylacidiphilales bacterium]
MSHPLSTLPRLLADRIASDGPLPFSAFMEMALYDPECGYYSDPGRLIGRRGDFYTSVSVGPLFGRLLADFAAGVWEALGRPGSWTVAEQGAHDGSLSRDVLAALHEHHPAAAAAASWCLVEPRSAWRGRQQAVLQALLPSDRIQWVARPGELPPDTALFYSNELVDALPVDRVCFRGGEWRELRVAAPGGGERFDWVSVAAPPSLQAAIARAGLPAVEGWVGEVRTVAEAWAMELYATLGDGVILTLDYGDLAEGLYGGAKPEGTLRAFAGHHQVAEVLADPGRQDLTADVDFSLLMEWGNAQGWRTRGFLDQNRFLTGLAARPGGWLAVQEANPDPAALRQFHTLTHPGLMGAVFKALVQTKGRVRSAAVDLPGMAFARPLDGVRS